MLEFFKMSPPKKITTKKRPFFKLAINQIEQIYRTRESSEDMSDILHELSFRRTIRSKDLMKKIKNTEEKKPTPNTINSSQDKSNDNLFRFAVIGMLFIITLKVLEIF